MIDFLQRLNPTKTVGLGYERDLRRRRTALYAAGANQDSDSGLLARVATPTDYCYTPRTLRVTGQLFMPTTNAQTKSSARSWIGFHNPRESGCVCVATKARRANVSRVLCEGRKRLPTSPFGVSA